MKSYKKTGYRGILAVAGIVVIASAAMVVFHSFRSTENAPEPVSSPQVAAAAPDAVDATAEPPKKAASDDATSAVNTTPQPPAPAPPPSTEKAAATLAELTPRERAILEKIPNDRFRAELLKLEPAARFRAFKALAANPPPDADYASLHVSSKGLLYYVCELISNGSGDDDHHSSAAASSTSTYVAPAAPVPISQPPVRHSRPGSNNILYLDFNGMDITDTEWNEGDDDNPAVGTYRAKPYDVDGTPDTFSVQEQQDIIEIWERVAEHFSSFDVDVTTEEPATFTRTTGHALITSATDQNGVFMPSASNALVAGVAYVNVFAEYYYVAEASPAFIYYDRLASNPANIAYAAAHELGHNLGLSHQATTQGSGDYYAGHGTGAISWAPIMGNGYDKSVIQWSQGEYYNANNHEDAIAIIAGKLGYREELGATTLANVASLTPDKDGALGTIGIIRNAGFSHYYALNLAASGSITLALNPDRLAETGAIIGSTDLRLEILDSTGNITHTSAPSTITSATLAASLTAGQRYMRIRSEGAGNPMSVLPTGYTAYGSIGQYTLATNIPDPNPTLATALNSDLTWRTQANSAAAWIGQMATTHDGIASAQSGPVSQGQSSGIIAAIEGTGTFSFWWKISADNSDNLSFFFTEMPDGDSVTVLASISGEQDWQQYTFENLDAGTRYIGWTFRKAPGVDPAITGSAWVDQVTWKPTGITFNTSPAIRDVSPDYGQFAIAIEASQAWTAAAGVPWLAFSTGSTASGNGNASLIVTHQPNETLAPRSGIITITSAGITRTSEIVQPEYLPFSTALDNDLVWTSGGYDENGAPIDAPWTTQTLVTHDGQHAARSGIILGLTTPTKNNGQQTWLETTVTGNGVLSFWWKVSSEAEASDATGTWGDICYFHIDGQEQARISGTQADWVNRTFVVNGSGTHTLRWSYNKDPLLSTGADAAWLDQVTWTSGTAIVLNVSPATAEVSATSGQLALSLAANIEWSATDNAPWLSIAPASGNGSASLTVTYAANTAATARNALITITGGGTTATSTVTQSANGAIETNDTASNGSGSSGGGGGGALSLWSLLALTIILGVRLSKKTLLS